MKKERQRLLKLILTAVMAALCLVLERFASFNTLGLKIGLGFVPVVLLAVVCGPGYAAAAWALADLIGALCIPFGPYHPGFTAIAFLMGWIYGVCLCQKKLRWWQVVLPTAINFLILGPFVNTVWLAQLYSSKTYWGWFVMRITTEYSVLIVLNLILIPVLFRLGRLLRRRMET